MGGRSANKSDLWVVVDVESNGPAPGIYSMTSFGAAVVERGEMRTFGRGVRVMPGTLVDPEAAAIDQSTYEKIPPSVAMHEFDTWLRSLTDGRLVFVSDNLAFDWQFINWYFHFFLKTNPFGWSGRRIGDLYCGIVSSVRGSWKHLRKTKHTHDPVDDARGNAEACLAILDMLDDSAGVTKLTRPKK